MDQRSTFSCAGGGDSICFSFATSEGRKARFFLDDRFALINRSQICSELQINTHSRAARATLSRNASGISNADRNHLELRRVSFFFFSAYSSLLPAPTGQQRYMTRRVLCLSSFVM
jgi:hypothetical protein